MDEWEKYEKLILSKLDDHDNLLSRAIREISNIRVEIGVINTKILAIAIAAGFLSGIMSTIITTIIMRGFQ